VCECFGIMFTAALLLHSARLSAFLLVLFLFAFRPIVLVNLIFAHKCKAGCTHTHIRCNWCGAILRIFQWLME